MAIQPKKKAVIKKGTNFTYNPATFIKEHWVGNFYEAKDAQEILDNIMPYKYDGRKFVFLDTETHPHYQGSQEVPAHVTRRWVGKGKEATPQDYPFCMSICDGVKAYTLYDSIDNNFAELKKLKAILEDGTIEKVIHNAKFDMHELANAGIKLVGKIHDTVVMAKLAFEERLSFALRDLAEKCGGTIKFEYMVDNYKKAHKVTDYRSIPKELMTMYANADVWNLFKVFLKEFPVLKAEELEELYENELKVMLAFWAMERYGMRADRTYEEGLKSELQTLTDNAEKAIYEYAGRLFNINSGKQLHDVMIEKGVDSSLLPKTDKGNPKADADTLLILAEVHGVEIVKKVLEFRKYEKLLGTYAVGIYSQRDCNDVVKCSINQTEATTGRTSITKPALQTLPKKDKRIRRIFIPTDGYRLVFMDLDQVEYRGFAHYAKAEGLLEAIRNGYDVHTATAALIFHTTIPEVTDAQRSRAKTINFGLIYGQGEELTAASLGLTRLEARQFKQHYFAMIPEAQPFLKTVHAVVESRGYIKNFYGRRRRLRRDLAYKAPNALIQGWAADYVKHKIVDIFTFLLANNYKTRMINFVHDELVKEVHETELHLIPTLRWLLSDFNTFRCPITAGVDLGNPSWGQKVAPTEDVGFSKPTKEEEANIAAFDIFNGCVFDLFVQCES